MNFESEIKELSEQYLADARTPAISGFVDQLFHVAAETGAVACVYGGENRLRFSGQQGAKSGGASISTATRQQATSTIEHPAAKPILRMMCARLAAICKEHAATAVSPYGGETTLNYRINGRERSRVTFANTPGEQKFVIEALEAPRETSDQI